jgi:hypothetical protein
VVPMRTQVDTSKTHANMSSSIMMSIKRIITGSYMFIGGSVLLSNGLHLLPILGHRSLGERGNPLYPAPLLACRGAAICGYILAICL